MKGISIEERALRVQSEVNVIDNKMVYEAANKMKIEKIVQDETLDSLKASVIMFQFLAIKPTSQAIIRDFVRRSETDHNCYELPSKLYFTFDFFDFPTTQSEVIAIGELQKKFNLTSQLKFDYPYYLVREDYLKNTFLQKEVIIKFEVDPSLSNQYTRHAELARYMYTRNLVIDIWNADSQMLFGSVKIPMKELMRHGQESATFSGEFGIIEPSYFRSRGSLQILMKNVGKYPLKEMPKQKTIEKTDKSSLENTRRKVISKQITEDPEEQRKIDMVNRYRANNPGLSSPRSEYNLLQSRDVKKLETIQKAIKEKYKEEDEKEVHLIFGKAEVVPLEIRNFNFRKTTFVITINDPDTAYLSRPEVTIVSEPKVWNFWVHKRGLDPPQGQQISKGEAQNVYEITLEPQMKCEVLVRILTNRTFTHEYEKEFLDDSASLKADVRAEYIARRVIHVAVIEKEGAFNTELKLKVIPDGAIIDHTFYFNEMPRKDVMLYLPVLKDSSIPRPSDLVITPDDGDTIKTFSWFNSTEIALRLETPSKLGKLRLNVLAYNDKFSCELVATWVVEISIYEG